LYHNDCPDCLKAIPDYNDMSQELAGSGIRVAFIEIPPYGPEKDSPIPADTLCLKGRLDSSKQWYITTPLVVLTLEGSVIESWQAKAPTMHEILNVLFAGSQ
jgi:thiol-disulfide isomerase/thioredoxin